MEYNTKSREELIEELEALRQQIAELKASEAICKKAVEEEIYRKKLRGIVEIAEEVFHEINQPMQAILGYTDLLLINASIDNSTHEKLTTIKKQTIRMSNLTKKLIEIKNYEFQDY